MNNRILRLIALVLIVMLVLCVGVGCGKKKKSDKDSEKTPEEKGLVVERTISPSIDEPAVPEQAAPTAPPEELKTEPEDEEVEPIAGDVVAIAYANASDINVRKKGSSDAEILGTLPLNTIVYVSKKDAGNDWSEISFKGQTAYVATYLLNFISDSSEMKFEGKASFNGDDVNIRSDSTTDSTPIGKASKGTSVDVFKKDAGHEWTMIRYEDKAGFVATRLLTFGE